MSRKVFEEYFEVVVVAVVVVPVAVGLAVAPEAVATLKMAGADGDSLN